MNQGGGARLRDLTPEERAEHFEKLPDGLPAFKDLFPETKTALEIEIGCGKGKFLVGRAQADTETNFLGIDYAGKWMKIGRVRAEKRQLQNLRFIRANAWVILSKYIPDNVVSVMHIYFPDPWPKKRHHKRRLLTEDFFELVRGKLKPGGLLEVATDNRDYYELISETASAVSGRWKRLVEQKNRRIFEEAFKTNYELKYEAEGRDLFYLEMKK